MHVSFKIHYRNNLIDKKDSYLISCPPSWDDRNYSYSHQLYPSDTGICTTQDMTVLNYCQKERQLVIFIKYYITQKN